MVKLTTFQTNTNRLQSQRKIKSNIELSNINNGVGMMDIIKSTATMGETPDGYDTPTRIEDTIIKSK